MPLLKRGMPVTPVQLENVTLPGFLEGQRVLLLSYQGQETAVRRGPRCSGGMGQKGRGARDGGRRPRPVQPRPRLVE